MKYITWRIVATVAPWRARQQAGSPTELPCEFDLYFRPVYAFELTWRPKNKTAVAEFDGVTGAMINGKTVHTGSPAPLTPEALFDINVDTVASLFPSTVSNVQIVS